MYNLQQDLKLTDVHREKQAFNLSVSLWEVLTLKQLQKLKSLILCA